MIRPRPLRFAALALVAALGPAAAAQTFSHGDRLCGTETPSTEEVLVSVAQAESWLAAHPGHLAERARGRVVTIPVALHLINSGPSESQGNVPQSQVDAQMAALNAAYLPMGYQFVVAFQQRVTNADWANLTQNGSDEIAMKQQLHLDVSRFLNAYFVPSISSPQGPLLGFATFPDANAEINYRQGVVNVSGSMPGGLEAPYNGGDTSTHEIGHWAGLYHTFQGGCSASGDGVADTPAEASPNFTGCSLTRDTCPSLPGNDPVQNFMDYSVDTCLIEFTDGQADRSLALMTQFRETIMTQAGVIVAEDEFEFEEIYVGEERTQTVRLVNLSNEPVEVTAVTTTSAAFTVLPLPATVPAGGVLDLEVVFQPFEPGPVSAELELETTSPDAPTVTITASGTARPAASVVLSDPAVAAEAAAGATTTETLTLSNGGPAVLDYQFAEGARVAAPAGGAETAADAGGPDAFGYVWTDSNELGGPAYDWVDISASGTPITLDNEDSETVPLPFSFPYYGEGRTEARIVSNGWIGFDDSGTSNASFNPTMPSPATPNDLVAPFWDNLNPALGGEVRYQDMGDGRFVVSWLAVPLASGTGTLTFQAVLSDDGRIRFQYQSLTAATTSATVGIENATGTDGLQVAYNESYLTDGLTVEFKALPDWLSVDPASGSVAVGATEDVTLTLDASGLDAGVYQELLELTTNDPTVPQPTRLHVVFAVGGRLAPPALAAPLYNDDDVSPAVTLVWLAADGATGYEYEVATDSLFTEVVASGPTVGTSAAVDGVAFATRYFWRVRTEDGAGESPWSLPFAFTTTAVVAGETGADRAALALGAAFPNPTTGAVTVPFTLDEAGAVTVRVLDVTGRAVATLADGAPYAAGPHRLGWNASAFPAGVYLVELRAGGRVKTGRVTVLR